MSDLKSKIPDLNEITSMAGKLFKDVKKSITEIIADYKENHPEEVESTEAETADKPVEEVKKPKAESKAAVKEEPVKEESAKEEPQQDASAAEPESDSSADKDK